MIAVGSEEGGGKVEDVALLDHERAAQGSTYRGLGMAGEVLPGAVEEGSAQLAVGCGPIRSEEHTSELQSQSNLVCRLLLEKKIMPRCPSVRAAHAWKDVRRGSGGTGLPGEKAHSARPRGGLRRFPAGRHRRVRDQWLDQRQ